MKEQIYIITPSNYGEFKRQMLEMVSCMQNKSIVWATKPKGFDKYMLQYNRLHSVHIEIDKDTRKAYIDRNRIYTRDRLPQKRLTLDEFKLYLEENFKRQDSRLKILQTKEQIC